MREIKRKKMVCGTIEITNNNMVKKMDAVGQALTLLKSKNHDISRLSVKYRKARDDYQIGSLNLLTDYYLVMNVKSKNKDRMCKQYFEDYHDFLLKEDFIMKFNHIINDITNDYDEPDLKGIIDTYHSSSVATIKPKENFRKCSSCSDDMVIESKISSMVCTNCGALTEIKGMMFEDEQFFYQDGQCAKGYNPSKHCRAWLDEIEGTEKNNINDKVVSEIKAVLKSEKIKNKHHVTHGHIRSILQRLNYSKYNKNVSSIRSRVLKIQNPRFTEKEKQIIMIYFSKVIPIYMKVKPPGKISCFYHPYYIYKIIEMKILDHNKEERILKLLDSIHLQSRETLIENDKTWKKICPHVGIKYKATDRNKSYYQY